MNSISSVTAVRDLENLLKSLKVMTIATVWDHGVWSAPVYYLYMDRAFYFFSSTSSRHIMGATSSPLKVAASIFQDDASFRNIKGVQMRGGVKIVADKKQALAGAVAYAEKFGIHGSAMSPRDTLSFLKQHYRASFYKFVPVEVIYMDNTVRIGFKEEIIL